MNQSNTNQILLYVFQGIGLLASLLCTLFGLFYITQGEYILPLLAAFISVILLVFLVNQLVFFKTREKTFLDFALISRGENRSGETIFLVIYLFVFLSLAFVQFHYLQIELFNKQKLKTQASQKVLDVRNLHTAFTARLEEEKEDWKTELSGNPNLDESNRMDEIDNRTIAKNKPVDSIHRILESKLKSDEKEIQAWRAVQIRKTIDGIDQFYDLYLKRIQESFPDFTFNRQAPGEIILHKPFDSFKQSSVLNIILSAFIILVINFCILIGYFLSVRPPKLFDVNPHSRDKNADNGIFSGY